MKIWFAFVLAILATMQVTSAGTPPSDTHSLESVIEWCGRLNPLATAEFAHFKTTDYEVAVVWIQKTDKKMTSRVVTYTRINNRWYLLDDSEVNVGDAGLGTVSLDRRRHVLMYESTQGILSHSFPVIDHLALLRKKFESGVSDTTHKRSDPQH